MKVAVFGGGAVGLGLSSCLLASGASVHLHVRTPNARDSLRRNGLTRSGILGEFHGPAGSFSVGTQGALLAAAEPEAILVCTKATAREEVALALGDVWPKLRSPVVVVCSNGWGTAEHLAGRIPRERIFNATVTTGFRRRQDDPTWVEVTVHGDEIHMGSLSGQSVDEIIPLCAALASGGIPASPSARMEADLWAKLLYNCALNPLAALLDVPYGALAQPAQRRAIVEGVVREIFEVLAATQRETHWPTADDYLAFFFDELLPRTQGHESSMLQDLRAGRATEIDALCGAVAKLGLEAGVAVPINDALATLVRAQHAAA